MIADTKNLRYKINPNKEMTPEILRKYHFFGRFVGKAVFERIPLNLYFDRCLIKHMIDACIVLHDIKFIDKDVKLLGHADHRRSMIHCRFLMDLSLIEVQLYGFLDCRSDGNVVASYQVVACFD